MIVLVVTSFALVSTWAKGAKNVRFIARLVKRNSPAERKYLFRPHEFPAPNKGAPRKTPGFTEITVVSC